MSDSLAPVDEFEGPPGEEQRIPLSTTGDVQRELAKVYRAMRAGRVSVPLGNGLTQCLFTLSKVRTDDAIVAGAGAKLAKMSEKRLAELTEALNAPPAAQH
jgi:hypothetical protein